MSLKIFQRWFNAPPQTRAGSIRDKLGKKHWMVWDVERFECMAELHLTHRGRWVGILSAHREEDGSITLADMMVLQRDGLRGGGLGKAMIQELIRWAEANNYRSIRGVIKPHDGSTVKYLTEWYSRQGFTVKDGHIFLALQRKSP